MGLHRKGFLNGNVTVIASGMLTDGDGIRVPFA